MRRGLGDGGLGDGGLETLTFEQHGQDQLDGFLEWRALLAIEHQATTTDELGPLEDLELYDAPRIGGCHDPMHLPGRIQSIGPDQADRSLFERRLVDTG